MSSQLKAFLIVLILAVVGLFGIMAVKERTTYSGAVSQELQQIKEMESRGIPQIEGTLLDGTPFDSKKTRGKVLIVSFWASWCDPCVKEFPSMLKLVEHFKGQLILIAVSHDTKKEDIESFLDAMKGRRPYVEILWDKDGHLAKKFGTSKLPENFIVGKDGKLVRKVIGEENWYSPEAIEYFATLIKAKS